MICILIFHSIDIHFTKLNPSIQLERLETFTVTRTRESLSPSLSIQSLMKSLQVLITFSDCRSFPHQIKRKENKFDTTRKLATI